MRILLVEDDINLQTNLKAHLELAKYSVDVADDGEIGLFQGQENPYDAAIIDIGLPKIDGREVVKSLSKKEIDEIEEQNKEMMEKDYEASFPGFEK